MSSLRIPDEILSTIIAHARGCLPDEACGLLAGRDGTVRTAYRIENIEPSPYSYLMDPQGQFHAQQDMRMQGQGLLAVYHSHPGSPAYPSATDVARAFFPGTREPNLPGCAYVIVGLGPEGPTVRAFEIEAHGVTEITIETA